MTTATTTRAIRTATIIGDVATGPISWADLIARYPNAKWYCPGIGSTVTTQYLRIILSKQNMAAIEMNSDGEVRNIDNHGMTLGSVLAILQSRRITIRLVRSGDRYCWTGPNGEDCELSANTVAEAENMAIDAWSSPIWDIRATWIEGGCRV